MHQPHAAQRIATTFATNLRLARVTAGLTQRALAQRLTDAGLPLDPSAITRLESGERDARVAELVVIAQVLDLTVGELVGEDLEAEPRLRSLQRRLDDATDAFRAQVETAARAAIDMQVLVDGQPALLIELKSSTGRAPKSAHQFLPWLTEYVGSRTPSAPDDQDQPEPLDQDELLRFAIAIVTGLFKARSTSKETDRVQHH